MQCKTCSLKHPQILHIEKDNVNDKKEGVTCPPISVPQQHSVPQQTVGFTAAGASECLLSIIPVKVRSQQNGLCVETYAFIDPGSTGTFCTEELRRKLNVKGKPTQIVLNTMGQNKDEQKLFQSVMLSDLEVSGLNESAYIQLSKVFTHSTIPVQQENIPKAHHLKDWPYLAEVHIPEISADVGLLIGANNPKAMEPWHVINSQENGPFAVKTILGWMVCGVSDDNSFHYNINRISITEIEQLLIEQYNTDFPERHYDDKTEMSQEDKQFMQSVQRTTKCEDGHYCIGLPLRQETVKMPNNRRVAEQRAINLKSKLKKNQAFLEDYKTFMNSLFEKGYAEEIPPEQLNRDDHRIWYIPHHGVYHPRKKKIRVVFDCTASYQDVSLNGELLQGPDLTNSLIGVLQRFREEPVAMMADIESMFYQVKVPSRDADMLRFLWWPGADLSAPLKDYRMKVHIFGATSSPSVATYALRRTAEDRNETADPEAVNTVLNHFYVDDCLRSMPTEAEAVILIRNLHSLCKEGGFNLTKWVSNNRNVLTSIPNDQRASEYKDLDLSHDILPSERALGVQWCTDDDTFTYCIKPLDKPATRRGILSVVNSLYDPIGCLSPVILPAKLLLRDLCKEKQGWDEEISSSHLKLWNQWQKNFSELADFKVKRCMKPDNFGHTVKAKLHHFSDASEQAYGTASYLVLQNECGKRHCSFVMSKSRVAPLKQVSIPRLELTAAVLAVKMDKMLKTEIHIPLEPSTFWTDSTTVLSYINNDSTRFKTFVANRVNLIREATAPKQWYYVKTTENPADLATRGTKAKNLKQEEIWLSGPKFLWQEQSKWPKAPTIQKEPDPNDPEIKNKNIAVNTLNVEEKQHPLSKLTEHYSSWDRLKRAVAWILKVKETLNELKDRRKDLQNTLSNAEKDPLKLKTQVAQQMKQFKEKLQKKMLTLKDLATAENELIHLSQQQWYAEDIQELQKNLHVKRKSQLYKIDPVLQQGILRVGGRLNKGALPEYAKHPAILSKHSKVASLILQDIHEKIGHCGRNYVLSKSRQKYWIPQVTSKIRKLLSKCTVCRKLYGQPGQQKMASLPEDRLIPDHPPFTNVGMDYFGPFEVKRGRVTVKRYGVLFTCLTIRAVHIEVADSLDTSSCINALRRFISRRGQVEIIRSDNGTNLVGADKELKAALKDLNQSQIEKKMQQKGITWIFNSPSASHQGGIWERQIRSVRRILSALLREQSLTDDSLHTLLCEVESIINGRPITTLSDNPHDLEPLTPNHLLLMKMQPNIPPGVFNRNDLYSKRRWRQVQYLANLFWTRWAREYIPLLQERQKWSAQKRNLQTGDVVLVVDNTTPRNTWTMGRIIQTLPDSAGLVRRVVLKTKTSTLERPVNKLCLLQEAAQT